MIQYQKPMAAVLTALAPVLLVAVYNFGWRVLVVALACNLACFLAEYLFARKQGKPVTMAALVTGTLLGLTLPPTVPFWVAILGAIFAIVFGKMVFGGFGKNIFNPAMAGRCFLYVSFPAFLATGCWRGPAACFPGGFARWLVAGPVRDLRAPAGAGLDAISDATTLAGVKRLEAAARDNREHGARREAVRQALASISLRDLFVGRVAGSAGETSALMLILALAYLLLRKAVRWQLVAAPALGMAAGVCAVWLAGDGAMPLRRLLALQFLAGGSMFALVFMTTEPVTAPAHKPAIWLYGLLVGGLAVAIRTYSVFNEGIMFALLLGNMFGPLIETCTREFEAWRKAGAKSGGAAT